MRLGATGEGGTAGRVWARGTRVRPSPSRSLRPSSGRGRSGGRGARDRDTPVELVLLLATQTSFDRWRRRKGPAPKDRATRRGASSRVRAAGETLELGKEGALWFPEPERWDSLFPLLRVERSDSFTPTVRSEGAGGGAGVGRASFGGRGVGPSRAARRSPSETGPPKAPLSGFSFPEPSKESPRPGRYGRSLRPLRPPGAGRLGRDGPR